MDNDTIFLENIVSSKIDILNTEKINNKKN